MNAPLNIVRNPLRRPSLLFLLSGILAASLLFLRIEANREQQVFNNLKTFVDAAIGNHPSPDAVVTGAMHLTHSVLANRVPVAGFTWPLRSCTSELRNPQGGSLSYARVLARLLECYDYPVRIGKLRTGDHFIVEARIDGRWLAVDPMNEVVFIRDAYIRYSYRAKPILQVYSFCFYLALAAFVLLNCYIYFGMRALLPWQKAVKEEGSRKRKSYGRPMQFTVFLN